jgi:hypothetical protein
MLYSEILDALYNGEINEVVKILNMSTYSTSLNKTNEEIYVIHTGFSFITHKEKEMEILAGFSTVSNQIFLIRQARANWSYRWIPLINGVFVKITQKNYFLNLIDNKICKQIEEVDDDYNIICVEYESPNDILNLEIYESDTFKILKNQFVIEFPLNRKFKTPIYLNGINFSATPPPKNDNEDYFEKRQTLEDYLRQDYGDSAEDAYWNIE